MRFQGRQRHMRQHLWQLLLRLPSKPPSNHRQRFVRGSWRVRNLHASLWQAPRVPVQGRGVPWVQYMYVSTRQRVQELVGLGRSAGMRQVRGRLVVIFELDVQAMLEQQLVLARHYKQQ
jgi:hypothetical protein